MLALCIGSESIGLDVATTPIDPSADPVGARTALIAGPAPAGYVPLMPASSGLLVTGVEFEGSLTQDLSTTGFAFYRNLVIDGETLEPGIFIGSGAPNSALPPDTSTSTTVNLSPSRSDVLAEILNGGIWSYDAQRVVVEFHASTSVQSLRMRWAFGTEEYPEYVGSSYNDVFGCYLFEATELGPTGGLFSSSPPVKDLCNASWYQLTIAQQDFLLQHQIAFDKQGYSITVNGPFFSAGQVVIPPYNNLEYDGATRVLTTVAQLIPGADYVLYLVIADTDDTNLDSGVFVSLAGSVVQVSETQTTSLNTPGSGTSGGGTPGSTGGGNNTVPGSTGGGTGTPSGGSGLGGSGLSPSSNGGQPTGGSMGGVTSASGQGTAQSPTATRSSGGGGCNYGTRRFPSEESIPIPLIAAAIVLFLARNRRRIQSVSSR